MPLDRFDFAQDSFANYERLNYLPFGSALGERLILICRGGTYLCRHCPCSGG